MREIPPATTGRSDEFIKTPPIQGTGIMMQESLHRGISSQFRGWTNRSWFYFVFLMKSVLYNGLHNFQQYLQRDRREKKWQYIYRTGSQSTRSRCGRREWHRDLYFNDLVIHEIRNNASAIFQNRWVMWRSPLPKGILGDPHLAHMIVSSVPSSRDLRRSESVRPAKINTVQLLH